MLCHNCGAPIGSLSEYFRGIRPDPRYSGDGSGRCVSLCRACVSSDQLDGTPVVVAARSAGWAERPPRRPRFTARDNTGRVMHG